MHGAGVVVDDGASSLESRPLAYPADTGVEVGYGAGKRGRDRRRSVGGAGGETPRGSRNAHGGSDDGHGRGGAEGEGGGVRGTLASARLLLPS